MVGGIVKGVSGMGLPTICLVLLTFIIDLKLAIIIVAGPAFITNLWQALRGKAFFVIWKRLWSYFLPAVACVWIGTFLLLSWSQQASIAALGVITLIYSATNIAGLRLNISARQEVWTKPFIGAINGVISGMTGTVMMPSIAYFYAIGLTKDVLVQAMGIMFLLLVSTLITVFGQNNLLITDHMNLVTICTLFAFGGMLVGQYFRRGIPEDIFRRVVLYVLFVLGIFLIFKSSILL